MNPLVSIIIPTYNRAHLITDTLDSILTQTYKNWECIIIDDGSNDNTIEILNKYVKKDSRFLFYMLPNDKPKGGNGARNYGFELSKGEYINWFDDDDIMLNDFLQTKMDSFTPLINLVIVSGYYVDSHLENKKRIHLDEKALLFRDYCLWKLKVLTPSILFRKSFLLEKTLFLYEIIRGQETEFFSRLFFKLPLNSYKIIDVPLYLYRQHTNTKTNKSTTYDKRFKASESYIALENFKRSIELNDLELINYNYKILIDCFFRGLENKHNNLSKDILKKILPLLIVKNKKLSFKLLLSGNLLLLLNRSSYRIERFFINYKLV